MSSFWLKFHIFKNLLERVRVIFWIISMFWFGNSRVKNKPLRPQWIPMERLAWMSLQHFRQWMLSRGGSIRLLVNLISWPSLRPRIRVLTLSAWEFRSYCTAHLICGQLIEHCKPLISAESSPLLCSISQERSGCIRSLLWWEGICCVLLRWVMNKFSGFPTHDWLSYLSTF